ncbi:MAG TPA: ABC transporter substrate-binding protein [Alphaproteobacteria bacterium]|nr:ABC transporter substrate-binding protein [Alphaproteobacteria bacterium]
MKGRHAAGLCVVCAGALVAAFSLQASDSPLVAIGFEAQATRFVKGTVRTASQLAAKTTGKPDKRASARRRERVSALVARRVETHSLSRFVLGPYMRQASEAERVRFEKALPHYLARLLAGELGAFADRTLTINEVVAPGGAQGDVLVLSRIAGKTGLPLRVDWRVRPTKAGPKLVDVIVEGLSVAVLQREAFIGELRRNGGKLDKLIARLEGRPAGTPAAKAFGAKSDQALAGVATAN